MTRRTIFHRASLVFTISILLFPLSAWPQQGESYDGQWSIVESSYATIYVDKDIDLKYLNRRIDVRFARYDPIERKLFLDKGISDEERLANKIDIIIRKAKNILDMHPPGYRVKIRIFEKERDLHNEYRRIFGETKKYIAFYIHKYRTVYISEPAVSESVLAHELGHSIIDSYFNVLPPEKVRELLACYVDVHLKD